MRARAATALGLAGLVVLGSCSGGVGGATPAAAPGVSPATMTDSAAKNSARLDAVRRAWEFADAGQADRAAIRESLKKVSWSRATWDQIRLEALRALLDDTPNLDDTRNMMRLMLPTETAWSVVEFIGDTSAERGWTDLSVALVRSWSRVVDEPLDDQRPERRALERLHPGVPITEVVFAVFMGRTHPGGLAGAAVGSGAGSSAGS
ncbi:MAG TPA: hypothetical protein DEB06_04905, partial [Phycisphaerales bacterium]|nr:hypothetical protein [Phycisphaerales bacterium]